jgi:lytic murein transglycosylase
MRVSRFAAAMLAIVGSLAVTTAAVAACRNTGSFDAWLNGFRQEALAQGLSRRVVSVALDGLSLDDRVISRDRKQGVFSQTFLEFSGRMVSGYRLKVGAQKIKQYRSIFQRVEQQFGVPAEVITAFWALETDFGANTGDFSTLRSLASLAYDCRRPELFRPQLMDALRLIEKGDLSPQEMIGAWAGEIGQAQFLPSDYYARAVDFDGDGRRDLRTSVPDVLASSANMLKTIGWRRGEPWLEEVAVPGTLDWKEADIAIAHPRSYWASHGVTRPGGRAIRTDKFPASLLLPMGRNGPAFLAYGNFHALLEWNQSLVYVTTVAYLATRFDGAPKVSSGRAAVASLGVAETRELQGLLARRGYDVGGIDGTIGAQTRAAVKDVQMKLGLPADSYPDAEFLQRLRAMR